MTQERLSQEHLKRKQLPPQYRQLLGGRFLDHTAPLHTHNILEMRIFWKGASRIPISIMTRGAENESTRHEAPSPGKFQIFL